MSCECDCGEYHDRLCSVGKVLRREWATPPWLTRILPQVQLDPCSNERSTVRALKRVSLPNNGLLESWRGKSVFVNPPYSDVMPWARKAHDAEAFIFLVNLDPSTKWWQWLTDIGGQYVFLFRRRIRFVPPPRIKESTNSKPQALVCNYAGAMMCGEELKEHGRWWSSSGVDLDPELVRGEGQRLRPVRLQRTAGVGEALVRSTRSRVG